MCCHCSKSEFIKSDSHSALKLGEYCNGCVKWHFANIMPADSEVTNMVVMVFGRTTNETLVVTNIQTAVNIQVCSLVNKLTPSLQLYEPNLPATWCNTCKPKPSCYCVACLFNPTSLSVRKVGNLQAASALDTTCWSRVGSFPHCIPTFPPSLPLLGVWSGGWRAVTGVSFTVMVERRPPQPSLRSLNPLQQSSAVLCVNTARSQ